MVSLYKVGERCPCCFPANRGAVINEELVVLDLSEAVKELAGWCGPHHFEMAPVARLGWSSMPVIRLVSDAGRITAGGAPPHWAGIGDQVGE